MELTNAQMCAIELNIEQMERFTSYANHRRAGIEKTPYDLIVREFYETARMAKFEMDILRKIGALLAPDSTEPLFRYLQFKDLTLKKQET